MEYIQCPHCQKQYIANDKLRSAIGKKIRCKHCTQAFEITLHLAQAGSDSTDLASTDAKSTTTAPIEHTSTVATPSVSRQNKQATTMKDSKKKLNIQWVITSVLAVCLILAAAGTYFFLQHSDATTIKEIQSITPDPFIKPIDIKSIEIKPSTKQAPPSPAQRNIQTFTKQTTEPLHPPATATPSNKHAFSQLCKDLSAEYWFRSYTLATASMDTTSYMELLDQNLDQADAIRQECDDQNIIRDIIKGVTSEHKPEWIKQEINAWVHATQDTMKE